MAIGKEKSRTERRKEARLDKKKMKFDSWIQHQQYHKQKRSSPPSLSNHPTKSKDDKLFQKNLGSETYHSLEQHTAKNSWSKLDSDSSAFKHVVQNKDIKNSKGKSEEHLEMGMLPGFPSREEDLEVERKLAKKLKVNNGKFRGLDDDLNILIGETTSMVDFEEVSPASEEEQKKNSERSSLSKKLKKNLLLEKEAEGSNRKKTKFEKYLEMEMQEGVASAEADLYMERKLAKKLKVKEGKLRGDDDDINSILEGIPSVLDFFGNEENFDDSCVRKSSENKSSSKKNKKMKTSKKKLEAEMASKTIETFSPEKVLDEISAKASEVEERAKYVAPHLRSHARNESMENAQIRRRIRGLLNRLSEANVESITGEMSSIFNVSQINFFGTINYKKKLSSYNLGAIVNERKKN